MGRLVIGPKVGSRMARCCEAWLDYEERFLRGPSVLSPAFTLMSG